ncbi:hypothetical protein Glove_519g99 [Diversispora epigaea]|uniref:Uncharacterized protein n=1 Tax=Diversispora epigaea TaxID=1348612 RepID=A0A397GKI7_9GLOM|nr:hypothetical protein Glove_519g99 [Diversispora epigaea]
MGRRSHIPVIIVSQKKAENSVNEISFTNGPAPRSDYTVTLFDNYVVYIGGVETSSSTSTLVDINVILVFDTSSSTWNTFQATGPDIGSRMGHTAILGSDEKIFVYRGIILSSLNPIVYFAVLDITSLLYQWSTPELKNVNNSNLSSSIYDTTTSSQLYVMNTENYSWISSYPQKKLKVTQKNEKRESNENINKADIHANEVIESSLPTHPVNRLSTIKNLTSEKRKDDIIILSESVIYLEKNIDKDNLKGKKVTDIHANEVIESSLPTHPVNRLSTIKNLTSEKRKDDIIILSESVIYLEKNIDKDNLKGKKSIIY